MLSSYQIYEKIQYFFVTKFLLKNIFIRIQLNDYLLNFVFYCINNTRNYSIKLVMVNLCYFLNIKCVPNMFDNLLNKRYIANNELDSYQTNFA